MDKHIVTSKFLELYKNLSILPYKDCCDLIMSPSTKMITQQFIYNITKKNISPNLFLMSLMMYRFPSEIYTLTPNPILAEKTYNLKKSSLDLVSEFQSLVDSINPNINSFMQKYNSYSNCLEIWKKEDLKHTFESLTLFYYQKINNIDDPQFILKSKENILIQFQKLGMNRSDATEFIKNNKPTSLHKPSFLFYENFKDNLNKSPPNLYQINPLLHDLFLKISKTLSDSQKQQFTQDYNNLIKNLDLSVFPFPQDKFIQIINIFIYHYKQNISDPIEKNRFYLFEQDILKNLQLHFHYSEILPKFFSGFFI